MLRSSKNADQRKQWWYRVAGYSAVPNRDCRFSFIYWFIQIYNITFSRCPQIAKASLGGQCLYKTKYALQMVLN